MLQGTPIANYPPNCLIVMIEPVFIFHSPYVEQYLTENRDRDIVFPPYPDPINGKAGRLVSGLPLRGLNMTAGKYFPPFVLVNPNSANGRTGREWPWLAKRLRRVFPEMTAFVTSRPNEAITATREAVRAGFNYVISVGGDGTANEVLNGIINAESSLSHRAELGLIVLGTGGDLGKSLGYPKQIDQVLNVLVGQTARTVDVGKLTYTLDSGTIQVRYFLNVASFGMGGEVDALVNRSSKVWGGFGCFALAILKTLAVYRNKTVSIQVDQNQPVTFKTRNVAVADG
ncbi:MAG: hypothetical protein HQK60_10025, partial [Deltaproteobacteria bacterium]|nr:hypothetical protein [Deltaproteobacteria bacterium]